LQLLNNIKRLGFDTAPFIYFIEQHPTYFDLMNKIIAQIDSGQIIGYSSTITLTEVLVRPKQLNQKLLEKQYSELLQNSYNFQLIPIDAKIAENAATLRSLYGLKTPDALQIAASLSKNCEAFLTNDKKLRIVQEIKILVLDDLLSNSL
jgi:predicted nucleic acid-binding protein